jgi:enterochelin esterase family protein
MDRRVYFYTPSGYEKGNQKYPVFYLLHGAGVDEDAWTNMGHAAQIMDNLNAHGKAKPMIVVMTNGNTNQAGAPNDVTDVPLQGDAMAAYHKLAGKFEAHHVKDLVPFIEKNYNVITGKDNRAIAGLSMGGMHTQTITNNNPVMLLNSGALSTSTTLNILIAKAAEATHGPTGGYTCQSLHLSCLSDFLFKHLPATSVILQNFVNKFYVFFDVYPL